MATPYQSIDPALLALQTAKKAMPASQSTQAVAKPSLNVPKQQSQAISTNITPPVAKIGGISSPFGAQNINSSPVLWWATPQEIGTRAKQLQSLPKAIPQTGTSEDIRSRLSTMGGDIVLRGKGLAEIKTAYPEFAHIDDETFKKIGGDIALRGKGIDDILRDYPELQQKINTKEKTTAQQIATPFVRFARWVADVWAWIQEGIDTWLSKLWILPDQTAINKKARVKDEEMTQQILGKKAWYEQYVQEWWRIAWSFIANAPANKLWTAGKMALWAAEWLLWWATYNLSTGEWVWSPVNLWLSTAIGAAIPWVVPVAKAIKWSLPWIAKWVKNIIPWLQKAAWQKAESLAVQWLLNANDAKKIVRTLKETWEGDVWSLWRRALERWIAWKTTEQALDTAKEIASKNYQWVRSAISEISDKVWTLAKDDTVAKAMTMVWKQADNINNRVWFNAVNITEIDELWRKALNWELTLLDKQRSKELIDEFVNIFKKSWEVSDTQIADVAAELRNKIKNSIEDIVDYTTDWKVNIREMNREVAVAKAFEQWIQNKATANELKQFAIQWIAWWVASNQWDFTTPEWIGKFLLWAFMWRQVGKLLWDPAVLWKIGKVVDKLSAWSRKWLLEFIKRPTQEIPEALLKEIAPLRNEIKNLALPLLKNVNTPNLPMASATNNKALLKWTNIANTPKPTPKTPPITVEKWAIGMWTPKVNNTPVIPPKTTVAPSVSTPKVISKQIDDIISEYWKITYKWEVDKIKKLSPNVESKLLDIPWVKQYFESNWIKDRNWLINFLEKRHKVIREPIEITKKADMAQASKDRFTNGMNKALENAWIKARLPISKANTPVAPKISWKIEYIPWKTDISDYSLWEYRNLVKQEFPWVHTENDIQRMYKTLQDEWTIKNKPVAPKKWMPKLWKEIMEQDITKTDDLINEAKKYKTADEFISKVKEKRIEWQRWWTAPSWYWEPLKDRISYDWDVTLREELTKHIKQPDDYFHWYLWPKKYWNDSATITAAKKWLADWEITIYRSVNKWIDTWRDGDWVYLVKDKAAKHWENALWGDYNILEKKVSIDDVWRDWNDINEWWYDSWKEAQNLKQIREQANKKPLPPLPKKWK
jgi:hypothetical protein